MTDGSDAQVWRVKRILESGDPERMSTEAEGWRRAETALDALQKRMAQRIGLLQQHVTGGGFAVLAEEHGLLAGHVDDLKYNAQSNGVGRKALADTLHEARPQIQRVASEFESTVVSPDGDVTASAVEAENAERQANQRAQEIMSSADDRFQQLYANTSSEPPPYQGPGDTGRTYRPGANRGGSVDPATGRYAGTPGYDPQTGVVLPDQPGGGPRTEFPAPGGPGASPGLPGSAPGGPGFPGPSGIPGAGTPGGAGPFGGSGLPFGPTASPAGTGPGAGPFGRGTGPAGASGRAPVSRPGVPMMGGPGGMHGGAPGRSGGGGRTPGGRGLPGAQPSSVYGPGGRGRRSRRDDEDQNGAGTENGPYDDQLFTVDDEGVDAVIAPEEAPRRFPAGPRITADPGAFAATRREYVVEPETAPPPLPEAVEPPVAPPSTVESVEEKPPAESPVLPPSVASLAEKYSGDAAADQPLIRPALRRRARS